MAYRIGILFPNYRHYPDLAGDAGHYKRYFDLEIIRQNPLKYKCINPKL